MGGEESSFHTAHEVVHRYLLPRMKVVFLQCTNTVLHDGQYLAGSRMMMLLSVHAGGTFGWQIELTGRGMQSASGGTVQQDTTAKQELDLPETKVAQTVVPTQQLLLWLRQINVGIGCDRESHGKGLDCCRGVTVMENLSGGKIIGGVKASDDWVPGEVTRQATESELVWLHMDGLISICL